MNSEPRTRIRRLPNKAVDDLSVLNDILDKALVAHVAVIEHAEPLVLPMAYARLGDALVLHGSTGSRLAGAMADGRPLCITVTLLDGLVYARSAFESSMNYRSAVIFGSGAPIPPEQKREALDALTDHLMPGRRAELRAPSRKELAATQLVRVPIREWSVKVSSGGPTDPPDDMGQQVWAGTLPLRMVSGQPVDAPDLRNAIPPPEHVRDRLASRAANVSG